MIKKEGLFKRLENIRDKHEELINRFGTNKRLAFDVNHSFAEIRNVDNIKKLSFESMFSLMKEINQKFNKLNNPKTRTKDNEKRKQKVLTNVADIYNELYYVYKSKYHKK